MGDQALNPSGSRTILLTKPRIIPLLSLCCAVILAGCGDSPPQKSSDRNQGTDRTPAVAGPGNDVAEKATSEAKNLFGSATIKGHVRFEGKRPRPRPLKMQGDRACYSGNAAVYPPGTTISKSGGVPFVFVYIKKGIHGDYAPPEEPVRLDQTGCMFVPHVFGIQVGQSLRIVNDDPTAHNVHGLFKHNEPFNVSQPVKGMVSVKRFSRPEVMAKFKCDVHGWMSAYAGVLRHPFFAVTDADGAFQISRLPAGDYELETWHELWGKRHRTVHVETGRTINADFTYRRRQPSSAGIPR